MSSQEPEDARVEVPLEERVRALARELEARVKALAPVARRLARAGTAELSTGRGLAELARLLRAAPLDTAGLLGEREALAGALEAARATLMEGRRRGFLDRFHAVFVEAGAKPALKAEQPPEYRAGRFHVLPDYAAESAALVFARLPVEDGIALDADAVLAAWRRAGERLATASADPERFGAAISGAYRALLARKNKPAGDRVELADLYAEVAFALQPERFREDVDRRTLTPYPRVQFVWDLLRWRSERGLIAGDQRGDVGVAVAGAATSKKRAFWLEDDLGAGQFYSSFRLVSA